MATTTDQLRPVWQQLGLQQREQAAHSLEFFARSHLPHHFTLPPSPMHRELFGLLEDASLDRGVRLAIAAPRGHAKSTIVSLAYVLWGVCYGKEPFTVLVSETASQANDLLSHVKDELENNERLRRDFPGVCEEPGTRPGPPRWRQDDIITRSGAKVTAMGVGKRIRGRRHGEHRPSLLILDDVESEETARSPDRRRNLAEWFNKSALKAGTDATNRDQVPTARGPAWRPTYRGKWTDTTVRAILVNRVYTGDMVWNRRTDAKFHRITEGRAAERRTAGAKRLELNDESDWMIVHDAHPAIVSRYLFERARRVREGRPTSQAQRGRRPTGGWSGHRSKFLLSGLLECALCGNRYQGYTRVKGRKRWEGSSVKSFSYACGGHITKGNSVCRLNAIPQEALEAAVTDAVLNFYRRYMKDTGACVGVGRRRLAEAVRAQLGAEADDLAAARRRIREEQESLDGVINNLLDNLTAENRPFVDKRLGELRQRREKLKLRDEELECLERAQASIDPRADEAAAFLTKLAPTLHDGLPQEKLTALRACVARIWINRPAAAAKIELRTVPVGQLDAVTTVEVALPGSPAKPQDGGEPGHALGR